MKGLIFDAQTLRMNEILVKSRHEIADTFFQPFTRVL